MIYRYCTKGNKFRSWILLYGDDKSNWKILASHNIGYWNVSPKFNKPGWLLTWKVEDISEERARTIVLEHL